MWLAHLERPVDAEIARDARLGHPPNQVDERRREQRVMALISERELDPADQEGQRERLVGMLDVVPARGKAVREPWGRDLGPVAPADGRRGTASAAPLPVHLLRPLGPTVDRVPVAVPLPGALARLAPGRVARRGANLDDRLHPPYDHVRQGCASGELVDLALKTVARP